jgi:glycosyltransferase involved in cell wall biosynthesis
LIHAFWYGLPVVTSDDRAAQNPEIVALEEGINGLTYKRGDVAAMADALRMIVVNRPVQRSMSEAARRSVEGKFTIQKMVDGLEAAIRYAAAAAGVR